MIYKIILTIIFVAFISHTSIAQCTQHVFSTVNSDTWTDFFYQDCDGTSSYFSLPAGGYTIIMCADLNTAFVLNGDGFVYPLLVEHPSFPSCVQPVECIGDLNNDGSVNTQDLLILLNNFGVICG